MSKQLTPADAVKKDLAAMKNQFQAALPNHISPEKFVRTIQTAVATSPQLVQANRQSLFGASMKAAQDGLLPDGKEAAIVTFKNKNGHHIAQYMPMVGGILKKVRNSGELSTITSQIVYENDDFQFSVDENGEHLKHNPKVFGDRGKAIGVYALAKTKDGAVYIETMTKDEIEKIKNVSRGKNGPWSGAFEHEMWRKSAIKRLSKRLPMSTDLEFTMRADDDLYDLDETEDKVETEPKDVTSPQRLSKMLSQEAESKVVETYADSEPEPTEEMSEDEVPI